jgi:hypothetical protein
MNEQIIKQLALRAHFYQEDDNYFTAAQAEFARLIVEECILACGSDCGTELIKQHFGVEK